MVQCFHPNSGGRKRGDHILSLPLISCVPFGKLFEFPQLSYVMCKIGRRLEFVHGVVWTLNERLFGCVLARCLVHSSWAMSVNCSEFGFYMYVWRSPQAYVI